MLLVYVRLLVGAGLTFRKTGASWGSLPLAATFWVLIAQSQRAPLYVPLAIPAAVLIVGALVLFQWAANSVADRHFSYIGDTDEPRFVFQGGPFAYIRNPFYTSYLLTNTAVAMAFPNWITAGAAFASLAILWIAAIFEERKFARSPLAEEYRDYRTRTGRFVPKL